MHTAGEETVNQEAVQDTFHSGNVYAQAQPRIQPCIVRKGKCLVLNRFFERNLKRKLEEYILKIRGKEVDKVWCAFDRVKQEGGKV